MSENTEINELKNKVKHIENSLDEINPIVNKILDFFTKKKPTLKPLDINGDGVIDTREKQIYDYYNNSMEKMQTHYIWGRVIDTLFTLGLVLLSIFVL